MRLRSHLQQLYRLPLLLCFVALPLLPFLLKVATGVAKGEAADGQAQGHILGHEGDPAIIPAIINDPVNDLRFALLASLDLLIRSERTLQQETGTYVSSLGRVPDVLGPITTYYRIDIARATRDQFLVSAVAAPPGNLRRDEEFGDFSRDAVSIDESFHVRLNFPMPLPPAGYLRAIAHGVLIHMQQALPQAELPSQENIGHWEGIYRGHFKYQVRQTSSGERLVVAAPVSEIALKLFGRTEITLEKEDDQSINIFSWMQSYRSAAFGEYAARAHLRHIYLGQKILFQESGRYSSNLDGVIPAWNGLAELTSPQSLLRIDDFSSDATMGYQAEIALYGSGDQIRNLWSINAFGQVSQTNPVEELMGRFEKARKNLEPNRRVSSETPTNPLLYDKISETGR